MQVWVVTGFELGWDNVCGVFSVEKVSLKELEERFHSDDYYIQVRDIEVDLQNWDE